MPNYFISTPIYYVNEPPHIGSAYTTLAADVLARAHRQFGSEVLFLTGTDEHGAKIAQKAEEANQAPQVFVDRIAKEFQAAWQLLGIEPDHFARTTDKNHEYLVGQVMQRLYDNKYIYPGTYKGWYCVACEEYKDVAPEAGTAKDPLCDIHHKPLEFIQEKIYYFSLSRFQDRLIEQIEQNQFKVEPAARKNEVLAFLKGEPLRDIPVTRSKVSWGIAVPFAPEQTVYVWFDALLFYLSFSEGSDILNDINAKTALDHFKWWPADLQLIGKDILRFHAVIWPALLMALELPLPKKLFVHGFFTIDGEKMSKTRGNVIRPQELVKRYGKEATRYLILSAFSFGADGDISLEKFDTAYTAYLANGLGNLVQRTIILITKFGIKPQVRPTEITAIKKAYLADDLTEAINQTFRLVDDANRYLATTQPWAMENSAEREVILIKIYEDVLKIAEALKPLMPETAEAIYQQLDLLEPQPLFPRLI